MKTKEEILESVFPITFGIVGIGWHQIDNEQKQDLINAVQEFADQETSTLYTRAQMIEFGEKVKEECLKGVWYKEGFDYENIQSINIENLLKK